MFFDPFYFVILSPALLLAAWAQWQVRATYAAAQKQRSRLSGAATARHLLDEAGLADVTIEAIPGQLSDHYDPHARVLRLSRDVYQGQNLGAVGIAAHEAGHALQHAHGYAPLAIRNAVVPVASFGSNASMIMLVAGFIFHFATLVLAGIVAFATVVFFQLVNLPVEFNASSRAKALLVERGIVPSEEMGAINRVLNAAALTYVAATLQAILTLLYYLMRYSGSSRD